MSFGMKNRDIESKWKTAVEHATPDVLAQILSGCREQKGIVLKMTPKKNTHRKWIAAVASVAAALALFVGGGFAYGRYQANHRVDSVIALDVNPSIVIKINRADTVLEVQALNQDAVRILDGMELKGADIDVALNALIGSMLKNGYINELANSVLLSVECSDSERGEQIQQRLATEIAGLLQNEAVDGAVLSQTVHDDDALRGMADTYGISLGKAALIQKILDQTPLYTAGELAKLNVHELNVLISAGKAAPADLQINGTASEKAYIGEATAKQIALADAGMAEKDVSQLEIELDADDGSIVYEIEFKAAGFEYDYEIDALSGDIRKADKDTDDDDDDDDIPPAVTTNDYLSSDKALSIALAHAGVAKADAVVSECKLDYDDGRAVYEIEFRAARVEYDYEIDAVSGDIRKADRDTDDDDDDDDTPPAVTTSVYLSSDKALSIALAHAGVAKADAVVSECKLDYDDGRAVYEIEFRAAGFEYDYEIDAVSGKIDHSEKDQDD